MVYNFVMCYLWTHKFVIKEHYIGNTEISKFEIHFQNLLCCDSLSILTLVPTRLASISCHVFSTILFRIIFTRAFTIAFAQWFCIGGETAEIERTTMRRCDDDDDVVDGDRKIDQSTSDLTFLFFKTFNMFKR